MTKKKSNRSQSRDNANDENFSEAIKTFGGHGFALAHLIKNDLSRSEKAEIANSVTEALDSLKNLDERIAAKALAEGIVRSPPGLALTNPKVDRLILASRKEVTEGEKSLAEVSRRIEKECAKEWRGVDSLLEKLSERLKRIFQGQMPEEISDALGVLKNIALQRRALAVVGNFPKPAAELICLLYPKLEAKGFGLRASSRIMAYALIELKILEGTSKTAETAKSIYGLLRYHLNKPGGISG